MAHAGHIRLLTGPASRPAINVDDERKAAGVGSFLIAVRHSIEPNIG
jgi:hypothetical protein